LRSHPHEFYLEKNMFQKHVCPCKVLEKSMPQTIGSSSKSDMYTMDFPAAHRLRHKKTTAAQVTTLTLYIRISVYIYVCVSMNYILPLQREIGRSKCFHKNKISRPGLGYPPNKDNCLISTGSGKGCQVVIGGLLQPEGLKVTAP
jgi:hypothetical protein